MTDLYRAARVPNAIQCVGIFRDQIGEIPWMPEFDDRASVEAFWAASFETDEAWVAERDGRIVGVCVRNVGEENSIGALYVAGEVRGDGIGRRLLYLVREDCTHLTVWDQEANEPARRFYRREGLVEVSREFDADMGLKDVEHRWERTRLCRWTPQGLS